MDIENNLAGRLLQAKQAYYYAEPIMSDAEYDSLEDKLRQVSPSHPVLAIVGAPIPAGNMLTSAFHRMPMGSQSKVNTEAEFRTWFTKNSIRSVHASVKGDGGSCAAYYTDGKLVQAITRGDGHEGEDITENVARFKGVPLLVSTGGVPFNGSVRFEGILTIADWFIADPAQSKNPRNAGNGIMRRKNGNQANLITAFAFDITETVDGDLVEFTTEDEKIRRLKSIGFNVLHGETFTDVNGAIAFFDHIAETRSSLPHWIDGVVLKCNDVASQKALGIADGRPKGQVAWKFLAEGAETVLQGYEITGGHTGALIPNARFKPVEIGGTTVSSASLANYDEVSRLDIAVGDTIWVSKQNDIIPKVTRVIHRPQGRVAISKPHECPFCGSGVAQKTKSDGEDGVILVCVNPDCSKKTGGKIQRWISSLDIQGIGDAVLDALIDRLNIMDAGGLYALHKRRADLATLVINEERGLCLGEKRAEAILEAIEQKRALSLPQFLGSLGLYYLGKRRVEILMQSAGGDLDALAQWQSGILRNADFAKKVGIPEVGQLVQDGIDSVSDLIVKLMTNGVTIVKSEKAETNCNRSVCISGKLPSGKKKSDYFEPLKAKGILLVDDVAKGLDFLVLADPTSTSTKSTKALKLGVNVISEDGLMALISDGVEI